MQWFRFYSDALDDPKVQRLPGDLFKAWINLLCLANQAEERGTLPPLADIAFRLRMSDAAAAQAVAGLVAAGLLDNDGTGSLRIHGWEGRQKKSDDVTARVHQYRSRSARTATLPQRFSNALDQSREETDQIRSEESEAREAVPLPSPRPSVEAPPAPKRAVARPTPPVPSVAELVSTLGDWAAEKGLAAVLPDEAERFHNYCLAGRQGKPIVYTDYAAACRNWITNPNYGPHAPPVAGRGGSGVDGDEGGQGDGGRSGSGAGNGAGRASGRRAAAPAGPTGGHRTYRDADFWPKP